MNLLSILVWATTICMSMIVPSIVHADPIVISFDVCQAAEYGPLQNFPPTFYNCCPKKPTAPIINGLPPPMTNWTRVRKAAQCTDSLYAEKLAKAYALMRALPDDDPRSLFQQMRFHCSHCGGSFITSNASKIQEGIDIHFNWLFLPWHRLFLYFHERILQHLLGDPTFSLSYWNWDNPFTVGDGKTTDGSCMKAGHNFPSAYASGAPFDSNRSDGALGQARLPFPDLTFVFLYPAEQQPLFNSPAEDVIASNLNIMYNTMVSGATTTQTFMGTPYRAGDPKAATPFSAGTLEFSPHTSVHSWTGLNPPQYNDMGNLAVAARDPVFSCHHSNVDRLWQVWKDIGPKLNQSHEDYTDPDFLDAQFLFYDEYKQLRRVTVSDALDMEKLGYTYQAANDAAWISLQPPKCANVSYIQLLAEVAPLPVPTQDKFGYYHLQAGESFVVVIERPHNPHGRQEFLTIEGITLDRTWNAGFDVYVGLVNPTNYTNPYKCAEYAGRFANMAKKGVRTNSEKTYMWKQSITRTLVDIQAPPSPLDLVITLVPLSKGGDHEDIKFTSITVKTS